MKVVEAIKQSKNPILSFEVIPPKVGGNINNIFEVLDDLIEFSPRFINVTKHANEIEFMEKEGKIEKIIRNKRPGTVGISAAIKNRYKIEVVPHLLCVGYNKYQLEDILIDLNYLEFENVFVIRGDKNRYTWKVEGEYEHASDLVRQISELNQGNYTCPLKKAFPTNFCIGVAGYPEKHVESPNLRKDLEYLKLKVELGAEFIITQMFFDVEYYKNFVKRVREIGIDIPIIAWIKPIESKKSLYTIPKNFFVNIPQKVIQDFDEARSEQDEYKLGIKYTINLIKDLLEIKVPGVHIFTMGRGKAVKEILRELKGVF
ncbi:methylenetetrahydrofolate reductase [Petrotoga sp. 9PWA.NaAc.5.4]|uniref:methylenetetrahydrofolate reductase n=1 Tax=Petrotoga sp. 9PWA.NaAc.5.4 TaxID=1434328 RepID=UPI000CBB8283|nr:methylenetetrahydrofolate reductase [Petrotoga sp. 9PWA.NaAc.5.4]PNR96775.1 methylenetetrahydrofolate reductase [Petrotoga sp. 9PWA.NaAc.5.4]